MLYRYGCGGFGKSGTSKTLCKLSIEFKHRQSTGKRVLKEVVKSDCRHHQHSRNEQAIQNSRSRRRYCRPLCSKSIRSPDIYTMRMLTFLR